MIFHENCLPADNSHEISCLICCFEKAAKFEIVDGLLQIIGGALRVKYRTVLQPTKFHGTITSVELFSSLSNAMK